MIIALREQNGLYEAETVLDSSFWTPALVVVPMLNQAHGIKQAQEICKKLTLAPYVTRYVN